MLLKVLLIILEFKQSGWMVTLRVVSAYMGCPVIESFYGIVALRT